MQSWNTGFHRTSFAAVVFAFLVAGMVATALSPATLAAMHHSFPQWMTIWQSQLKWTWICFAVLGLDRMVSVYQDAVVALDLDGATAIDSALLDAVSLDVKAQPTWMGCLRLTQIGLLCLAWIRWW